MQAADVWQFDHLAFTLTDRFYTADHVPSSVSLVSQSESATVVSLTGLATASGSYPALDNYATGAWGTGISRQNFDGERYRVGVDDGYRVTGVTVQVTFAGDLRPGAGGGSAYNELRVITALGEPGESAVYRQTATNLDGKLTKVLEIDSLALAGDFGFQVDTFIETYAGATRNGWGSLVAESYANIQAENIQFTFHTSPVPEPETCLMLGAGLALLGGLARRRQRESREG
ncbi:hypothetical protein GCM10007386_08190 [Pseudoduganella dura]|nr:hypothetical protein GCM10007386_08190 [Pseudoduganella dura]